MNHWPKWRLQTMDPMFVVSFSFVVPTPVVYAHDVSDPFPTNGIWRPIQQSLLSNVCFSLAVFCIQESDTYGIAFCVPFAWLVARLLPACGERRRLRRFPVPWFFLVRTADKRSDLVEHSTWNLTIWQHQLLP